ncbi:MAG: flagellar biosynthetic protein FliR [Desulfovibrionaceae bacterium]|nr:flagellar biosynthetic protein FliR [Desulfovibrionaceae bacterium]
MITLPITVMEAQTLLLILIRLGIVIFMLPFFDGNFIPRAVKFPLIAILSIVFLYYVNIPTLQIPSFSTVYLILLTVKELIYGFTLGICTRIIFMAIRIGLEFTNIQIGFSMANVIDPTSGMQAGAITNFFYLIALLFFLLFNGHIAVIRSLAESFSLLPVGDFTWSARLAQDVLSYSGTMFYLAFKISAPVVSAMIVLTLAMALVGKAVPTMNLMLFAFPIKIAVGFIFLLLILELLAFEIKDYSGGITSFMGAITKMSAP